VSAVVMRVALSHCPVGSRPWHTAGEAHASGGFPLDTSADSAKLAWGIERVGAWSRHPRSKADQS
jgi:hypothetical protein